MWALILEQLIHTFVRVLELLGMNYLGKSCLDYREFS